MKINEILSTDNNKKLPVPYLYHATRESSVESILKNGLMVKYFGAIHEDSELHHRKTGAIYLSRKNKSGNLPENLFSEPVVVLKIDTDYLDPRYIWPDDYFYTLWEKGEIFFDTNGIGLILGINHTDAEDLYGEMLAATDQTLPFLLRPFWRWYLMSDDGGEIAYTKDISPNAVISVDKY